MADFVLQTHLKSRSAAGASPHRFAIEAILFCTYAAFGLSWIALTPLLSDLQRELGVGSAAVATLHTAVSVAKIVAPLGTGVCAVRIGLARTLLAGSALIALAAFATALAPGFATLLAARFAFGLGGAVVVTLLGPMVMRWFPRAELPLVNALNNVAVNTGIAITLFSTLPLATRLGWRGALACYATLSLCLAVAWARFGREPGRDELPDDSAPTSSGTAGRARFVEVWRMPATWIIGIAFAAPLALYLVFNTWLPRYYVETLGFSRSTASHCMGLVNLVGIPAAIGGGVLTRRLGLRRPFLVAAGAMCGVAAFGMIFARRPEWIVPCAILLGAALFLATSPLFTTAMELPGMTPERVSLLLATVFSMSYALSSAAPPLTGWLRDRTGSFVPGLCAFAGLSFLLLIAGVVLPETGPARPRVD